jgi:chromosome segregation ATPase
MSDDSLTLRVLIDIREELRETNKRLDQTRLELKDELSQLKDEISQTRVELKEEIGQNRSEIVEVELRLATRFTELTAATRDTHSLLVDRFDLRDRMERCEREIEELKTKVG